MVEITKLITESQLFTTQYSSFLLKIESNLFSKQTKTNKKINQPKKFDICNTSRHIRGVALECSARASGK